ncbi:hypothetical protein [Methanofollis fontis]|uniref:Uncharacterized protein n=1 Tax=Methanofollis fontis TaxID=2052832 RepID=A0A483CRE3_9EURY|nr:hypothetical protein [Methanofollis fontis]TAJ45683.1 hypothetical protein CUJ86_02915 [Methanofollis fontis]
MHDNPLKKGLAFLGLSTSLLLGSAATGSLLFTAAAPVLAVMNILVFLMTAGIILIWLRLGGLPDGVVWLEIGGFAVLEIAICALCVIG